MNRKLLVPSLAFAAAALLGGCATGYEYRQGTGDYYYGQPSVDYDDDGFYGGYGYGIPYGGYGRGWGLGFGYGYGYGFPFWGPGYPYWIYGYPYYDHRRHRRHHPDPHDRTGPPPRGTVTQPPPGRVPPPMRPLLRGPRHTPPMRPDPAVLAPAPSGPTSGRQWTSPPPAPRVDREPRFSPPPRVQTAPRVEAPAWRGKDRDERRNSRP